MADATHSSPKGSIDNEEKRAELIKELSDLVFVCYQFAKAFNIDLDAAMHKVMQKNLHNLQMKKPKSADYIRKLNDGSNSGTKLDEAKVRQIKFLLGEGADPGSIAEHFDVSLRTISAIKQGTRWGHVTL